MRGETFLLTYGDGVSDVNLQELVRFHRHGKLATVTAVRPPARFGGLEFDGDLVTAFTEKPQTARAGSTAGSLSRAGVTRLHRRRRGEFELDVLPRLVAKGQLAAFRHDKFWQCMDTLRDKRYLETLWQEGRAPWRAA